MIEQIGAFAGLAAFLGLAFLALLSFTHGRDIRRLREWAGSAPERDADRKESTSAVAAQRAEELRRLEEARTAEQEALENREERRRRREAGLPEATAGERLREGFGRLAEPRYLVAILAVFLVLVAGGAFLVLGSSDDGASAGNGGGKKAKQAAAKVSPGEIEVAVLNGTAVSGLAATFGDTVEREGFQLGTVGNTGANFSDSVVMFTRGNAPEAKQVAKALGIEMVQLMTVEVEEAAVGASVAAIVGEDNAAAAG